MPGPRPLSPASYVTTFSRASESSSSSSSSESSISSHLKAQRSKSSNKSARENDKHSKNQTKTNSNNKSTKHNKMSTHSSKDSKQTNDADTIRKSSSSPITSYSTRVEKSKPINKYKYETRTKLKVLPPDELEFNGRHCFSMMGLIKLLQLLVCLAIFYITGIPATDYSRAHILITIFTFILTFYIIIHYLFKLYKIWFPNFAWLKTELYYTYLSSLAYLFSSIIMFILNETEYYKIPLVRHKLYSDYMISAVSLRILYLFYLHSVNIILTNSYLNQITRVLVLSTLSCILYWVIYCKNSSTGGRININDNSNNRSRVLTPSLPSNHCI